MPTLSDLIEQYLNALMEDAKGQQVEITRSEVAAVFDCVPSQINYVLTTRFTPARGFLVESQRGSGGHVRIRRVYLETTCLGDYLSDGVSSELSQEEARHICDRLFAEGMITERERALMVAATRRSALPVAAQLQNRLRASLLKAMLYELAQQSGSIKPSANKTKPVKKE